MKIQRVIPYVFLVVLVSGCAITHKVTVEPRTNALPPATKIPLHAGVYYSPQFSDQEYTRVAGSQTWVVPIGAASVRLFDDLLPRVFEKTSRISNLSADELRTKEVDVVIAPSLEHFDFRMGLDADSDRYSVSYRTTLYTKRGVPVASWVVVGNATSKTMGTLQSWIVDDMTDAAVKFLEGFERDAGLALAAIAKNPEGQSVAIDLSNVVLSAKPAQLPGVDPKLAAALQQAGVVTLQITARSETERQLVVRGSDMRLRLMDNQIIEPSSVSSALAVLDRTSQTGGVVAVLTGIAPFGVLASVLGDRSNQAERELQFRAGGRSLFGDRTLSKGKEETGIVLFRIPKGMGDEEATLTAWVVDPASAEGAQIKVPIPHSAAKSGNENVAASDSTIGIGAKTQNSSKENDSSIVSTSEAVGVKATNNPESPSTAKAEAVAMATVTSDNPISVGDRWTYKLSDQRRAIGTISVEIVGVNGQNVRERFTREGYSKFAVERDVDVSFRPTRFQTVNFPGGYDLPEFAPYLLPDTTLKRGQSWDGLPGVFFMHHAGKVTLVSHLQVVGQETVQVPAGTFRAWKIETDSPEVASSGINVKAKCTFWYSPEVKRTVKMSINSITSMQAYASDMEIYELESFHSGK